MLTGQAKEDFEKWIVSESYYLGKEPLSDLFNNALIIEWFDSVGIYINILNLYLQGWFYYRVIHLEIFEGSKLVRSRTEATTAAIKKANEIYNSEQKQRV